MVAGVRGMVAAMGGQLGATEVLFFEVGGNDKGVGFPMVGLIVPGGVWSGFVFENERGKPVEGGCWVCVVVVSFLLTRPG